MDISVDSAGGSLGGALLLQAGRMAKAIGLGIVGQLTRSSVMPVIEFIAVHDEQDRTGTVFVGRFVQKRPGDALGIKGTEVDDLLTKAAALRFLDSISEQEICWADRQFLRLQVRGSGLE